MSENGAILNGNKTCRLFNITASNVVIDGLTFINANSSSGGPHDSSRNKYGAGSALYIAASNVRVENCEFINNTASGTYSAGGALFTAAGCVNNYLVNCTFKNNTANIGGAIRFHGNNDKYNTNNGKLYFYRQ